MLLRSEWSLHCTDGYVAFRFAGLLGITELEEPGILRQPERKGLKRQGETSRPLSGVTEPARIPQGTGRTLSVP